jgi:hypothetical protein
MWDVGHQMAHLESLQEHASNHAPES